MLFAVDKVYHFPLLISEGGTLGSTQLVLQSSTFWFFIAKAEVIQELKAKLS